MSSKFRLIAVRLPSTKYTKAAALQGLLAGQVATSKIPPLILFMEHPCVLTLGKHANPQHILLSKEELSLRNIDVIKTDRGGEITAHMPGQLIVYPILALREKKLTPKSLVFALEQAVIEFLSTHGIKGQRSQKNPGIWVNDSKICSIGLRFSSRVSKHGLALNLTNDLSLFDIINPCGIKKCPMTRTNDLAKHPIKIEEAVQQLGVLLGKILGYQLQWIDNTQRKEDR